MGSARLSIKSFSSKGRRRSSRSPRSSRRRIFADNDIDGLMEAFEAAGSHPEFGGYVELEECEPMKPDREEEEDNEVDLDFLEIVDSLSTDVFDGLTLNPSNDSSAQKGGGECRQTREDVDDAPKTREDVDAIPKRKSRDASAPRDPYDDVIDEFLSDEMLTDEESTTQSSGGSTVTSNEFSPSMLVDKNKSNNPTGGEEGLLLACPDDSGLKEFLALTAYYGGQAGENIDELNRFLFTELEIDNFASDVEALRQEVVNHGFQKLSQVEWAELFKSVYNPGASDLQEHLKLTSMAASEVEEEKQERQQLEANISTALCVSQNPSTLQSSTSTSLADNPEQALAREESIEMPYPHCQLVKSSSGLPPLLPPPPKDTKKEESTHAPIHMKKKNSFLSKLKSMGSKHKKTPVTRVKLDDGSMASVSIDTVTKLEKCHWV